MKKTAAGLILLFSSLSFAQGYEQAKNLLDLVSKEMKSKKNIRFDFAYVLENKKEQIRQEMEGNVTLAGDQYKLSFLEAIQLFDGTKTYTIVPENEEITIGYMGNRSTARLAADGTLIRAPFRFRAEGISCRS